MKTLEDNSVDSIVSDPPYGISFMAKKWDYDVPSVEVWKEAMRVLKPGGHALIACGTRTQHRMVCNIEDAGFEIRDVVSWIYGSGFPKSLNISKAIDKAAGAKSHDSVGFNVAGKSSGLGVIQRPELRSDHPDYVKPSGITDEAKQWDGWGTALKPACEFFTLCRKPLSESTVAKNVLKWGTGGINIDGCRVELPEGQTKDKGNPNRVGTKDDSNTPMGRSGARPYDPTQGRFPANLILDSSQEVLDLFPETAGGGASTKKNNCEGSNTFKGLKSTGDSKGRKTSKGSSSRFFKSINDLDDVPETDFGNMRAFYCPKASKKDRNEGCEELEGGTTIRYGEQGQGDTPQQTPRKPVQQKNTHPTVKPTALMAYLCRLITPTGGVVLDPYMGSGSTGKAAVREGFSFVGIELDKDYYEIAKARVTAKAKEN